MKQNQIFNEVKPWLKPGLTVLLGLILMIRPASIAAVLAGAVGYLLALVGAWLLLSFFFGSDKSYIKLIAAVILLPIGYSVIQDPMTLVSRITRFVGVILLLQSLRSYFEQSSPYRKPFSVATCIIGLVLLVMPGTVSRLVFVACGVVLLIIGAGMVLEVKKYSAPTGADDDIIDAR